MKTIDNMRNRGFEDILQFPADHVEAVAKLRGIAASTCANGPVEVAYIAPPGRQLSSNQSDASKAILAGTKLSIDTVNELKVGRAWELGAIAPRMRVFAHLRLYSVGDLLIAAADELEDGHLRSSFSLLRSALEIASLVVCLDEDLSGFRLNLKITTIDIHAAYELLSEIDEVLHRRSFGTKLDFDVLLSQGLLKPETIMAEKSNDTLSVAPDTVASTFKSLERKIAGAYKLYQFLCDFAHPNALLHFEYVAEEKTIRYGNLILTHRRYDPKMRSVALINSFRLAIKDALEIFGICIETTLTSRRRIAETADSVASIARETIHEIMSTTPSTFPTQMPCPCQSGMTTRVCCETGMSK